MLARGLTRGVSACTKVILRHGMQLAKTQSARVVSCQIHSTASLLKTYFTKEHEWVSVTENIATIGITSYAQEQLGDIVFCEVPEPGEKFDQGESMAVVESVKAASDLYAAVSGEVTETNEKVVANPGIINSDPLGDGWLVKMKLSKISELDELMEEKQYDKLIQD